MFEAEVAKLNLFSNRSLLPKFQPKEALPFEGDAPPPAIRKRKTYVTSERAIKYGKTPGCKGCERSAEGVPHSDACHERFRVCLEESRLAEEARATRSTPPTSVPMTPTTPAPETPAAGARIKCSPSCDHAPEGQQGSCVPLASVTVDQQESDFWVYDKDYRAWKRVHVRPRKRLFAPVGKDCPFDSNEVHTERVTEWKCRNRVSLHKDDWQRHRIRGSVPKVGLDQLGFTQRSQLMRKKLFCSPCKPICRTIHPSVCQRNVMLCLPL